MQKIEERESEVIKDLKEKAEVDLTNKRSNYNRL